MTRQSKTPRQRAEEALAVAERAVKRWAEKRDRAQDELEAAEREHTTAVRRRDYLKHHPDLAPTGVDQLKQHTITTSTGDNT